MRASAISSCVEENSATVKGLREQRDRAPDDRDAVKQLRKKQTLLRLMQSELTVEEAIRERTMKVSEHFPCHCYPPCPFN